MIDDDEPQRCDIGIMQLFDHWHIVLQYADGDTFVSRQTFTTEADARHAAHQWSLENVVHEGGIQ